MSVRRACSLSHAFECRRVSLGGPYTSRRMILLTLEQDVSSLQGLASRVEGSRKPPEW